MNRMPLVRKRELPPASSSSSSSSNFSTTVSLEKVSFQPSWLQKTSHTGINASASASRYSNNMTSTVSSNNRLQTVAKAQTSGITDGNDDPVEDCPNASLAGTPPQDDYSPYKSYQPPPDIREEINSESLSGVNGQCAEIEEGYNDDTISVAASQPIGVVRNSSSFVGDIANKSDKSSKSAPNTQQRLINHPSVAPLTESLAEFGHHTVDTPVASFASPEGLAIAPQPESALISSVLHMQHQSQKANPQVVADPWSTQSSHVRPYSHQPVERGEPLAYEDRRLSMGETSGIHRYSRYSVTPHSTSQTMNHSSSQSASRPAKQGTMKYRYQKCMRMVDADELRMLSMADTRDGNRHPSRAAASRAFPTSRSQQVSSTHPMASGDTATSDDASTVLFSNDPLDPRNKAAAWVELEILSEFDDTSTAGVSTGIASPFRLMVARVVGVYKRAVTLSFARKLQLAASTSTARARERAPVRA